MSLAQNKAIVVQFYKAVNQGNLKQAKEMLAPNIVVHTMTGSVIRSGDKFFEHLQMARSAFPDVYYTIEDVIAVEFQAIAVKEIKPSGNQFDVVFEDGTMEKSRKILLAFGVIDEFPDIENFGEFWGTSVFHCPYCHAWEVRDEPLAVFGNAETGIEMAVLLKNWSADLVLCTNSEADQKKLLENHKMIVREEKITRLEGDNGRLETIVFETSKEIACHGMLIRPKQKLRSDLAEKLGCELNEFNLIKTTNVFYETSVKGVYAAGDITSPMQAIAVAVFQGSAAASGLNHSLIAEDFV
nr:FAD-dependent oxidoreductase [Nostoc sp. DedSLP05]MDZ8100885.1 FAD-dependent oxidoreductase [Nostoc sp. DedSLP01]